MKYILTTLTAFLIFLAFLFFNYNNASKKSKKKFKADRERTKTVDKDISLNISDSKTNLKTFEKGKIKNTKILDNGVVIKWIVNNKGRKIENGEMVLLEYRLALPDGKIIDGNNKLNLPFIPFVLGYSMQTPGWDCAIRELSIGDFAKIEIPSELAYGLKGIKGIIPSNSDNWLYVKVLSFVSPGINKDGITSWKLKNGNQTSTTKGKKELTYHTIVSTPNKASIINTYLSNSPMRFKTGQTNIVPGLRELLMNANKGDKYYVIVESKQAYGTKGYLNLIQANESVFFNIDIIDSREI
jgi:FKBP-type peptidyl-prolyl cis-trans isomerase